MKFLLVALSLIVAVTAQGYNYPAPQVHHEHIEETEHAEQAVAPVPDYLSPVVHHEEVPAEVHSEYIAPAPVHIPEPVHIAAPVHIPEALHIAESVAPAPEYIPPQAELHDDGYRYRTVKRYRFRRH